MSQFSLPQLPFKYDALEPHIDAKTMEIHHTKHHATYIDKLNTALSNLDEFKSMDIEELMSHVEEVPAEYEMVVRNNGGGHYNHSLFWSILSPSGGGSPQGGLAKAIDQEFGSFAGFVEKFAHESLARFGSGWAWLVVEEGKLHVCSTPNQDNPLMHGNVPILGLDVWEHAYYLKYQNRRPEYVEAFWQVVNWEEVERRYQQALS